MKTVIYCRVSSEKQAGEDKVSIEQQLAECRKLCEANSFEIVGEFIDKKQYKKTKSPKKGRMVQPSGNYDDRPGFVAMLEQIESGKIDAIVYLDNSRLGRHLRVLGTLANSLDIAQSNRPGKPEVKLWEAANRTMISRVMLGIMISIAQDENETRKRRVKMGKIGTLQQGRFPGTYRRFGYDTVKEKGKRGYDIRLNEKEAKHVKLMFDLAESGKSLAEIRDIFLAREIRQKGTHERKREWSQALIGRMLNSEDYTGKATWTFSDGQSFTVDIPAIVTKAQFKRVQAGLQDRMTSAPRNTKATWAALQHIAICGDCKRKLSVSTDRYHYYNGERREYAMPLYAYKCVAGYMYKSEECNHDKYVHRGPTLDYEVWQFLVENAIKNPDSIRRQVEERRDELQTQGDDFDSEIAKAKRKLREIEEGNARLTRQLGKGTIKEKAFEVVMLQQGKDEKYWLEELDRLTSLRDNAKKLQSDIEFTFEVLSSIRGKLPEINQTQEELRQLPVERRIEILHERKRIVQAICESVTVYGNGEIEIAGLVSSTKAGKLVNHAHRHRV